MRFLTKLAFGLTVAACSALAACSSHADTRDDALYSRQKPASVDMPVGGVTAPLLTPDTHPMVEVTINGRVFHFQVETGAWFNTISADAAAELGLMSGAHDEVTISGLSIGEAKFGAFRADVTDHPPGDCDGQLGLPAFADLLLTVDFPHGQLHLDKGALPAANGQDILPLTSVGPLWGVPVVIGDKTFTGFIDTQSGDGLAMAPPLARTVAFTSKPVTTGSAHGPAIGEVDVTTARLAGDLAFGGYRFQQPLVASFPLRLRFPNFGVLMGPPLLSHFVLTLDQKDRLARFERAGDPVIPPPPSLTRMGLVMMHDPDGHMRVAAVQPGGGAEQAGLSEGDEILAVDGAQVNDESPLAGNGRVVRFHLRHGSVERDVEVTPAVLVP